MTSPQPFEHDYVWQRGPLSPGASRAEPLPTIPQLIARAHFLDKTRFEAALMGGAISSGPQWSLLVFVEETPGITGADLAKLMRVTPQAVQVLLSQLERKGLVIRTRHGRTMRTELTPAGRDALEAADPAVKAYREWSDTRLSERQRQQLHRLLAAYIASAASLVSAHTRARRNAPPCRG